MRFYYPLSCLIIEVMLCASKCHSWWTEGSRSTAVYFSEPFVWQRHYKSDCLFTGVYQKAHSSLTHTSHSFEVRLKKLLILDQKKSKISSSRKLGLKIKLLETAAQMLQEEKEQTMKEREAALAERVPPLNMSGLSLQDLVNLCKDLHHKIDVVDEERYDINLKVSKNDQEIENMTLKITEIQSKFKKPTLKRVRISAEAMLSVLLGSKHKDSFDFKANLKTVKKEEEKKEEVTDWRKNVEAMSGMEGRKKLFNTTGN